MTDYFGSGLEVVGFLQGEFSLIQPAQLVGRVAFGRGESRILVAAIFHAKRRPDSGGMETCGVGNSSRWYTQAPQIAGINMSEPSFQSASPYKDDILALPVADLDAASDWYCKHFGMTEIERRDKPNPSVILERDGLQIGFAINGGDPSQEGAAIRVNDIEGIKAQLESNGIRVANTRVDEHDGRKFNVFFVVAPDGLCYCFNEPVSG